MENMESEPAPRKPFDRHPDEGHEAFQAFALYRDAGPGRTLDKVARELGKSATLMARWSSQHEWVDRCVPFDVERDQLEQAAKAKVAKAFAEKWERRRLQAAATDWQHARLLTAKAREMLGTPLFEETAAAIDKEGRATTIIKMPGKWSLKDAAAFAKIVSELQSTALANALSGVDDGFDPTTASPEACREYLEKQGVTVAVNVSVNESTDK